MGTKWGETYWGEVGEENGKSVVCSFGLLRLTRTECDVASRNWYPVFFKGRDVADVKPDVMPPGA